MVKTQENNIVKYDNYLNTIKFNGLKSIELNVVMALCSKMKEQGNKYVQLTYKELKEIMFLKHITDEELRQLIRATAKKLGDVNGEVVLPTGKIVDFNLFPTRIDDPNEHTFIIRINEDVMFILNDLTKNFTLFELSEFISLSSKYSKHLYRLLKQYRSTGYYTIGIEELKSFLDIPDSYENKRIRYEILVPSVKELSKFFIGLDFQKKTKNTKGREVIGYIFTFEAETIPKRNITKQSEQKQAPKKSNQTKKTNKFNDFPQRDYSEEDIRELEKLLLKK